MLARAAADSIVFLHFGFIVFVVFGALLLFRWRWLVWLHVPALLWGTYIEFFGGVCPLTPLEQSLRVAAGEQGYSGGFVEHYIVAAIYPAGLTASIQFAIGIFVIVVNAAIYGSWWYRRGRPGV